MKGWLSLLGVEYPRTHVLGELFDLLEDHAAEGIGSFRDLQDLTPFAVQFRYEDLQFDEEIDRAALIRQVTQFIEYVEGVLR